MYLFSFEKTSISTEYLQIYRFSYIGIGKMRFNRIFIVDDDRDILELISINSMEDVIVGAFIIISPSHLIPVKWSPSLNLFFL